MFPNTSGSAFREATRRPFFPSSFAKKYLTMLQLWMCPYLVKVIANPYPVVIEDSVSIHYQIVDSDQIY